MKKLFIGELMPFLFVHGYILNFLTGLEIDVSMGKACAAWMIFCLAPSLAGVWYGYNLGKGQE